jgi:hypothetical protein
MNFFSKVFIILLGIQSQGASGQGSQVPLAKEIREVRRYYSEPISFVQLQIPEDTVKFSVHFHPGDLLFRIESSGGTSGYLLSTRARGRYDYFDYAVIWDSDLKVEGMIVTRYRSDHGAAICQRRWLRQFTDYNGGPLQLGKDIDGVSGGTISAASLVADMERCHMLVTNWVNSENGH